MVRDDLLVAEQFVCQPGMRDLPGLKHLAEVGRREGTPGILFNGTTVVPVRRISLITANTSSTILGTYPIDGSSRRRISGSAV